MSKTINTFVRYYWTATLLLLAGCTSIDLDTPFVVDPVLQARIIDQTEDRFPGVDPLYISDEIKQLIDENVMPLNGEQARVRKIQEILFGENYLNLQYTDLKTHTAMEAFEAREGNCLSAMNLFVAMARYANLDASYQTVEVQPSWDRRGGLLVLSKHINATGRFNARKQYVADFTPEIALQQLTSREVSDQYARGLYFNNLGVEAMIEGDFEQSLVYFKNALFLEPELSMSWNNIGAAYKHLGEQELAEYSYQMAFNMDNQNATAVSNLVKLYRNSGNERLAAQYETAIARFNNRNPYFHFARGQAALAENDFDLAGESFRRAIRLKEAEPDFYLALAEIYTIQGNERRADELISSAQELIALNAEIYQPSDQKLRIIDSSTDLSPLQPGFSIRLD
jgi:Flp pilus assembly protein TadD